MAAFLGCLAQIVVCRPCPVARTTGDAPTGGGRRVQIRPYNQLSIHLLIHRDSAHSQKFAIDNATVLRKIRRTQQFGLDFT